MSNAKGLWDTFAKDAEEDPLKSPDVEVVNGAQSGGATAGWADPSSPKTWGELDESLSNANVTRQDITVIWFVIHNSVNHQTLDEYSTNLESDARAVLDLFVSEFPNLKVVWIQPMIYAGYSTTSGNYEPFAHQSGVVAQRIVPDHQNWPFFVGYGPYLWADGLVPRDDGLTWLCSDFKDDGNHPDRDGKDKNSEYLMQFFHEDTVASIAYLGNVALVTVPDVVGLAQATAEAAIVSSNLVVGAVSTSHSDTVSAGNVISQDPTGGSSAGAGTAVDLVVSLGPAQMTTVPDVVGLAQATAESSIVSTGLVVGAISTTSSDTIVAGNVISQSPSGGTSVLSGTAVDLVVSTGPATGTPMMISPVDGSTLSGSSQTFTWSDGGAAVTGWRLQIGTSPGARDIYGKRFDASVTSDMATGLPTDGSTVYVTLVWTIAGVMSEATYVYTASGDDPPPGGTPIITSPVPGSVLTGASETFAWSAEGASVSRWRLEVGTTPGGRDLFVQNLDSAVTSTLVSGLPTDGSTVYVNLKWRIGTVTSVASYVYTASGGPP